MSIQSPVSYRKELFQIYNDNIIHLQKKYDISDKVLKDSLDLIKDWYTKQPHFPDIQLDDSTLILCLANNKFSVEKTKWKLENLLTAKTLIPDFFSIRDTQDPRISKILNAIEWIVFPQTTPEKYRVVYIRLKESSPENFEASFMYTTSFILSDMRSSVDSSMGDIYILDFANASFGHVKKTPPLLIQKCAFVIQSCYSFNLKGMHMINMPSFAEFIFGLLKTFHSKKIGDRIHIHKNLEDLFDYIPKNIFPKDMRGDENKTSIEIAETVKKALQSPEWRKWFIDTEPLRTNEAKRPPKTSSIVQETFGVTGSFRKLDID